MPVSYTLQHEAAVTCLASVACAAECPMPCSACEHGVQPNAAKKDSAKLGSLLTCFEQYRGCQGLLI